MSHHQNHTALEYEKKYRNIRVKVSDGSMILGTINITTFSRLSDYLKQSNDKFVTIFSPDGDMAEKKISLINKEYIVWAETWD